MDKKQTIIKKAKWLEYCLEIGWQKSQLDDLSAIWDKYRDEYGNFKSPIAGAEWQEKCAITFGNMIIEKGYLPILKGSNKGKWKNIFMETEPPLLTTEQLYNKLLKNDNG